MKARLLAAGVLAAVAMVSGATETNLGPASLFSSADTNTSEPLLQFNFHGVPISSVLDYMSEAGGFIVIQDTQLTGTVDVYSRSPLSREASVSLLNKVLKPMGCAALRTGRMLTIYSNAQALKYDVPIKLGNRPSQIPDDDAIVTQIIPVSVGKASDLAPVLRSQLPETASLTASESGNSIVVTATQNEVKRVAKIVIAIEKAGMKTSNIKIFTLRNADAKNLASVVNEAFSDSGKSNSNSQAKSQTSPSQSGRSSSAPDFGPPDMPGPERLGMPSGPGGGPDAGGPPGGPDPSGPPGF